ncbi:hypothetical protein ACFL2V_16340 [Pseudomonadota bacterium]
MTFVIPLVWENITPKNHGVHLNALYTGNVKMGKGYGESLEGLVISGGLIAAEGRVRGVRITGGWEDTDPGNASGLSLTGLVNTCRGNTSGVRVAGGVGHTGENMYGVSVSGLVQYIGEDVKGISLSGAITHIKEKLSGLAFGTLYTHAGENGRFAVQIGLINHITDYNPEGTVLQIGLYSRAGDRASPLINIRRRRKPK